MLFKLGNSYIWLFYYFAASWMGLIALSAVFRPSFTVVKVILPVLPLFLLFIIFSEVRSKTALDTGFVARFKAGEKSYSLALMQHILGFVVISVLVTVCITQI